MHKCQRCHNPATLHITEILAPQKWEEVHLCEACANKYMQESSGKGSPVKAGVKEHLAEDEGLFGHQDCPHCGIKFVDFRNSGRLGCAHDYEVFREELTPLLENIHGETQHCGKVPRRYPKTKKAEGELVQLRTRLKQAVSQENYEEAAKIRDRIKDLEEA